MILLSKKVNYPDGGFYHMVSDESIHELHEFAAKLGLGRKEFYLRPFIRYDLTDEQRDRAKNIGAVEGSLTDIKKAHAAYV